MPISDETLDELMRLSEGYPTSEWISMWEGRDHEAGDSFILTKGLSGRGDDLYINEEGKPARVECLDLIAAARTHLPALIAELRAYRAGSQERSSPPA